MTKTAPEITEAFEFAGLATEVSRWGFTQHRTAEHLYRVVCDDATYYVMCLTADRAEACVGEVVLSGRFGTPEAIAGVLAMMVEQEG